MALRGALSRLLSGGLLPSGQLAAGIAQGFRAGLVPAGTAAAEAAAAPSLVLRQCSSLAGFLQRRLGAYSGGSLALQSVRQAGLVSSRAASSAGPATPWQQCSSRGMASKKLTPRFKGCKLKPYSSYKWRFKMTGSGKIRYMRPGAVHKHFNKSNRQNRELSQTQVLYETYAKTMRKLGFKMRAF